VVVGNPEVLFGIADDPAEDSYGRDTSSFATGAGMLFSGASHRLRYLAWNTDARAFEWMRFPVYRRSTLTAFAKGSSDRARDVFAHVSIRDLKKYAPMNACTWALVSAFKVDSSTTEVLSWILLDGLVD
jgi:hypothetical protein